MHGVKGKKMEEKYSWKRTDEIEIDLADLLKRLCGQWKQIAACAIAAAVILGSYGWLKGRSVADAGVPDAAAEEILLTEAQEQAVADAVQLNKEIQGLETYLENSVLMQIDPYQKARHILFYRISQAERTELPVIAESYLNFILNGSAAQWLGIHTDSWKMDKNYAAELIAAYQKSYSFPYQIIKDNSSGDSKVPDAVFYVEVTGRSAREAETMAFDMQEALKEYSAAAKKHAGRHNLVLISDAGTITWDSSLQTLQHDKKALLSANRTNLKAMTDAFNEGQSAAYQIAAGEESTGAQEAEQTGTADETVSGTDYGISMKNILLGFFCGSFLYCSIFSCWYLFRDTVKSVEEMKRLYTFPVFGEILLYQESGKESGEFRQVINRIRILCQKRGISKLYATSDAAFSQQEKEWMACIRQQLGEWGIHLDICEHAFWDSSLWDEMLRTGTVLIMCRTGNTTHKMIDDMMQFCLENGIVPAGAAAFSKER